MKIHSKHMSVLGVLFLAMSMACVLSLNAPRAWADEGGKEGQEEKITADQLPAPVKATLDKEAAGGKIEEIVKVVEEGKTTYEADVMVGEKKHDIEIAPDGTLIKNEIEEDKEGKEEKEGIEGKEEKEGEEDKEAKESEEKEGQEEKITADQLPAVVKATLDKEAAGGKIEEIVKVVEEGKITYEADVMVGEKKHDIEISPDGTLIKNEIEEEKEGEEAEESEEGSEKGAKHHEEAGEEGDAKWMDSFDEAKTVLVSTGRNPYYILEPGYTLTFGGGEEKKEELTVTVLNETKTVDGVETRVVEERETIDGKPAEISRNYYAISKSTNNVYYFGEDSKEYKDGKVVTQEGSWEAGVNGAKFGLMMPGKPEVGARYYQEMAPKTAMDRAKIVSLTETVLVPAGKFENCLKTEESSSLEPDHKEYKLYAPNVGLIRDGDMVLSSWGPKSDQGKGVEK